MTSIVIEQISSQKLKRPSRNNLNYVHNEMFGCPVRVLSEMNRFSLKIYYISIQGQPENFMLRF